MINDIDLQVNSILEDDEKILSFHLAHNSKSGYFIITRLENQYITFRISNHPTSAYYSNRTFDSRKSVNILLDEIRNYMDTADWYHFKYEDYFSLKALYSTPFKFIQYYIDNTMGIFDFSKTGIVFYQCRRFSKNHKEFNIVSESFQKALRKLYSSGLISDYRIGKDEILVYVNKSGKLMMRYMEEKYIDRFKRDEKR